MFAGVIIFLGIIVVMILWFILTYNLLVSLKMRIINAWSQIDVQLKRRHDLIPNLVEIAKGYMAYERETLEKVIKARTQAISVTAIPDKEQAENLLTNTLRSLFAVAENYPNLKADQQMLKLQEELTSTENRISFARQYYNDEVTRFNTAIQTLPTNIVAGIFNFTKSDFFVMDDKSQQEAPQIKF